MLSKEVLGDATGGRAGGIYTVTALFRDFGVLCKGEKCRIPQIQPLRHVLRRLRGEPFCTCMLPTCMVKAFWPASRGRSQEWLAQAVAFFRSFVPSAWTPEGLPTGPGTSTATESPCSLLPAALEYCLVAATTSRAASPRTCPLLSTSVTAAEAAGHTAEAIKRAWKAGTEANKSIYASGLAGTDTRASPRQRGHTARKSVTSHEGVPWLGCTQRVALAKLAGTMTPYSGTSGENWLERSSDHSSPPYTRMDSSHPSVGPPRGLCLNTDSGGLGLAPSLPPHKALGSPSFLQATTACQAGRRGVPEGSWRTLLPLHTKHV